MKGQTDEISRLGLDTPFPDAITLAKKQMLLTINGVEVESAHLCEESEVSLEHYFRALKQER